MPPRIRPGSYATATHSVSFLGLEDLGPHGYGFNWSEQSGIVYTCHAGHVDIAHVRKAADCTGYLAAVVLEHIEREEPELRFKLTEPSVYFVTLVYPQDWSLRGNAERERIAREVARRLAQYLAYSALTWHEIITWFGYRPRPHVSEFPSAFSWEDTYSNLLGTQIAGEALEDGDRTFDQAVTVALQRQLESLEVQPARVAKRAAAMMKGQWYSRKWLTTTIQKRNFDVGLDDGYVTPCLVPSVSACPAPRPRPLPAPTLGFLADHGFSVNVELEARVWEERKVMEALGPEPRPSTGRLSPSVHFPLILSHIEAQAARMWD